MSGWKLFIDDIRTPADDGAFQFIARNSEEAIRIISDIGCPSFVSFDHDLGEDDIAVTVVKWLIEKDLDSGGKFIPLNFSFTVHSANPVGKKNIEALLSNYLNFKKEK